MKTQIQKGTLQPCPVCGSHNINWGGYYHVSLTCNNCGFEMYAFDDTATEEEYFKEWNLLNKIDTIIEGQDLQIEFAKKIVDLCKDKKTHYIWTKKKMEEAREKYFHAQ
jgi:hypothetical protein